MSTNGGKFDKIQYSNVLYKKILSQLGINEAS